MPEQDSVFTGSYRDQQGGIPRNLYLDRIEVQVFEEIIIGQPE